MFDGEGDQTRSKTRSLNSIKQDNTVPNNSDGVQDLLGLDSDHEMDDLKADNTYLFNLKNSNKASTDLPLYSFDIYTNDGSRNCYKAIQVLLDTGASSNYISPALVNPATMKVTSLQTRHEVETANGQISVIKDKVEFSVSANGVSQRIQAYVFDTKFNLILGQQWFKQYKPIPNWSNSSWSISGPYGVGTTVLSPVNLVSKSESLAYVLSKRQMQRSLRKNNIDELFLVHVKESGLHKMVDTGDNLGEAISKLLVEYKDVFTDKLPPGLPPDRGIEHVIETGDAEPVCKHPFKMSPLELDELQRQLKDLLDKGFIQPSSSPWGAPVLFVRKKSGELRMCIDFRIINSLCTKKLNTPLPRIDECLERLGGARYFSQFDLTSGYHQIRLSDSDVPKTCFVTRYGAFEWLVLPFGLRNSPAVFQNMMNKCLSGYVDRFVQLYLDDILVYSKTAKEHLEHIRLVLERFRQFKLYANPKKCKFNQKEVEFLGMKVSADGILPSDTKVKAIKDWPTPTNVQEVRQFVGLASHYRRFIRQFSSVAAPLTELTKGTGPKRRGIIWSQECQKAFEKLKFLLTHAPCLQPPDVSKPYIIETDSSDFGCGAVLLQKDDSGALHPLAFESKKFSMAERNYPAQERELLGVLHALRVWRCFIDGADYVVYTDHNPLQYLRSQAKPTARLVRWLSEIETYDPKILYKPGKMNEVPDALSRRDGADCIAAESSMEPRYLYSVDSNILVHPTDWPAFYLTKPELVPDTVKSVLESNRDKFVIKQDKVYRLVKVNNQQLEARFCPLSNRAALVNKFHKGFGHAGQLTVFELMRKRWWWPNMRTDIQTWLLNCKECQLASSPGKNKRHAPMVPLDIPPAFGRWHLDFVGELPLTQQGNKWLLTAVDYTTNWPIARAVPEATAEAVADFIYEEIVMRFGCPQEILTDRGANFMSTVVKLYMNRIKTNHKFTSAFHPRTNGKCERLNGILKAMLRKYVNGAIHIWDKFVDTALFAARVRHHRSTGYSPFYLVYGREPLLPGDYTRPYFDKLTSNDPRSIAEHTARELENIGQIRAAAAHRMKMVSESDKRRWDAAVEKLEFEIGDHVLLRNEQKYGLEYNWIGPFVIVGRNEANHVYKLETISGEPYSSWVHIDRLKGVKAESIDTPWYNPTVSRAAWRSEMGLDSRNKAASEPVEQVDQRRSTFSGGNDVVPKLRFKPNVKKAARRHRQVLEGSGN